MMPDITKCANDFCPLRLKCYRYTCTPSHPQQSYCVFHPFEADHGEYECDMWLLDPGKIPPVQQEGGGQ